MKQWTYTIADNCRTGTMICTCCGKKITTGEYRYRMKYHSDSDKDYFINQHRECTLDDPNWAKLSKEALLREERNKQMLAEAIAFRDKWNTYELDELIEDLTIIVRK